MYRFRLPSAALAGLLTLAAVGTATAALQGDDEAKGGQVLIGRDDDSTDDPIIQPPGVQANQSLRKGDQLLGGYGADVLIGRLGPDTLISGKGDPRDKGDVIVGGAERGSDATAFPNFDVAKGGWGDDAFIWAPGDGSDAFAGGEPRRSVKYVKKTIRVAGRRVRTLRKVNVQARNDTDTLIIGTMTIQSGDNSLPQLFDSRFGRLPKVNVSDRGLPATIGDSPAQPALKGFCEIVPAPPGLGYEHLVRFLGDNGAQAVTIRVKDVEQVLCGNRNAEGITQVSLGAKGDGPATVVTQDFQPTPGSKLDALVD